LLTGQPVQARPVGAAERTLKWARRQPALAALIAVSFLALVSLAAGGLLYARYQQGQVMLAQQDLEKEVANRQRLDSLRGEVRDLLAKALTATGGQNWESAQGLIDSALARIHTEDGLGDLRADAEQLQDQVQRQLNTRRH